MLNPRPGTLAFVAHDEQPPQGAAGGARTEALLDETVLAGLRDLDPGGRNRLLERVFGAFRTSTARLIPQLQEAQRTTDLQGIRHVAHTLKSSAASVGGLALSRICADLENRIRLGQADDLSAPVDALIEEAAKVLAALQRLSEAER
jgi:HPt (histidine-containing phosphotransfer) domain-containing protein